MGEIEFRPDPDNWMMRFTPTGISFNHEDYPDSLMEDFAQAFIELMEKQYAIKFIKKEEINE